MSDQTVYALEHWTRSYAYFLFFIVIFQPLAILVQSLVVRNYFEKFIILVSIGLAWTSFLVYQTTAHSQSHLHLSALAWNFCFGVTAVVRYLAANNKNAPT